MSSRWLIVAPIAVLVTGALFFLMRDLIDARAEYPDEIVEAPEIKLGREIKPPPPDDYNPRKPVDVTPPEVEPLKPNPDDFRPTDPTINGSRPTVLDPPTDGLRHIEGSAQPIIRGTQYPPCGKGAGEAVIDFVVEPDGSVSDVRVIRASSSCFGKAAERDARRWRYRPEVVDGQAVRSGRKQVVVQYQQEG